MDRYRVFVGALILALCFSYAAAQSAAADSSLGLEMLSYVKGIEGKKGDERRTYIREQLGAIGVWSSAMPFDTTLLDGGKNKKYSGENILVNIGKGKPEIVVGAHLDAVFQSPGANDNGSGVAVLLELIERLKSVAVKHRIVCCFFDLEEPGLIGSAVYVRRNRNAGIAEMINLDVEGTGSEIFAGPTGQPADSLLLAALRATRDSLGYAYYESADYPESDYLSFVNAHISAISVSVVPAGDGRRLSKWVADGFREPKNPQDAPLVLRVMHTPGDKSDQVTGDALVKSFRFVAGMIARINAMLGR
ncbi:MAG TPA: M28 family peptidase [Bacteroidota bacterium]|nr:M28 family peptidase [Bacteroidota bacterium]